MAKKECGLTLQELHKRLGKINGLSASVQMDLMDIFIANNEAIKK